MLGNIGRGFAAIRRLVLCPEKDSACILAAMKNLCGSLLFFVASTSNAGDFLLIGETLPASVHTLQGVDQLPENPHRYATPLGVTSRCYQAGEFLILSDNATGTGYELTTVAPGNASCLKVANTHAPFTNAAGIHLGMAKARVLDILKAPNATNDATLLYNRDTFVDGKSANEQTWVDVEFSGDTLRRFKVFVSVTK